MIRNIEDPEHPLTLEQLRVVSLDQIHLEENKNEVKVYFTPTIPHCSSASIIGLMLKAKLVRSLPEYFKVVVAIQPGSHNNEAEISKQLKGRPLSCRQRKSCCSHGEQKHLQTDQQEDQRDRRCQRIHRWTRCRSSLSFLKVLLSSEF